MDFLGGILLFVALWLGKLAFASLVSQLGLADIWVGWLCQLEAATCTAAGGLRTRLIAWGWLKAADSQASALSPAAPLAPDVYGAISRYLPDAASRASLFATCTSARGGVLSSCHSHQITLVGSTKGLQQRAELLVRARSNGLINERALNSMTLRLKGMHTWSTEASQQVVAALPGVRTLVLRDCIMPASQLAPLLSGGPITCVRLEGNSDLSDGVSAAGQGLLDLLSLSPSLASLELAGVTQHFRPTAPAAKAKRGGGRRSQLPVLSPSLKRLSLQQSGDLEAWAHVFKRLPALECLEMSTPTVAGLGISCLQQMAPSFMCLRTLNLPDALIQQCTDASVLRALLQLPMLEHVQLCDVYANYYDTPDSLPSSVPWQTLRLRSFSIITAQLLPPSALAALTGPCRLGISSFFTTTDLVAAAVRRFASRLAEAEAIRAKRGLLPLLEQCELTVDVSFSGSRRIASGQELLHGWADLMFDLAPLMSSLSIHSVCLMGLKSSYA